MLRTLFATTILAGVLAGKAVAQAPDSGCALPSEPEGVPAALDAAITGPADKDRACMKALLIPAARMMFVSLGADGAPRCTATASKSRAASTAFKRLKKALAGELPTLWCRPSRPLRHCPRDICRKGAKPMAANWHGPAAPLRFAELPCFSVE